MNLLDIKKEYYSLANLYEQVYALLADNSRVIDDYCVGAYNLYRDCKRLAKLVGSPLSLGFAAGERPSYSLFFAATKCASLIEGRGGSLLIDTSGFGVSNFESFGFRDELNGVELSAPLSRRFLSFFDSVSFRGGAALGGLFSSAFSSSFSALPLKVGELVGLNVVYPLPFVCNEYVRLRLNGDVIDFIGVDKKGRLCVFAVNRGESEVETKGRAAVCAVFLKLLLESEFGDVQRRIVDFPRGDVVGFAVLPEQEFFEPTECVRGVRSGVVYCGQKGVVVVG